MKAGKLNLWMTHYQRVPGKNELGEPDATFTPVTSFAAGVAPVGASRAGDEFFNTGHMLIRIDRVFEIRYSAVKAEDRVAVNGTMFEVLAVVDPEGASGHFQLKCKNVD